MEQVGGNLWRLPADDAHIILLKYGAFLRQEKVVGDSRNIY